MFPLETFSYFEIQAFITALIFLAFSRDKVLRWFPVYLFFILAVELSARYIRKVHHEPNVWIYNLSIPVEYLFYSWVFYMHFHSAAIRRYTRWFIIAFGAFVVVNLTLLQGLGKYNSHSVLIGSVSMILLSAYTLFELYNQDQEYQVWAVPLFWIATGVLLFNAGEFAYNLFSNYLVNAGFDDAAKFFASINNTFLIPILYYCLTIGFICTRMIQIYKRD